MSHASDGLYVATDTPIHRLAAHIKIVALLIFVIAVVATPVRAYWAFGVHALLIIGCLWTARIPVRTIARRMTVETPFVIFAALLPFVASGSRVKVVGISLSESGLLGAWGILAKATLGVLAAIVLSASTTPRELLAGLDRLRLPSALVAILSFMIRYVAVVADDLRRMRVARESRGYSGGRTGHLAATASGVGTLFVRSYERGERVALAMRSRGYTGTFPRLDSTLTRPHEWSALAVSAVAVLVAIFARVLS